jgi:hypothetical protein
MIKTNIGLHALVVPFINVDKRRSMSAQIGTVASYTSGNDIRQLCTSFF